MNPGPASWLHRPRLERIPTVPGLTFHPSLCGEALELPLAACYPGSVFTLTHSVTTATHFSPQAPRDCICIARVKKGTLLWVYKTLQWYRSQKSRADFAVISTSGWSLGAVWVLLGESGRCQTWLCLRHNPRRYGKSVMENLSH